MRIVADTQRCEGHGQCAAKAPAAYALDDDGFVVVLDSADAEQAKLGARACPVAALTVVEA